jgi:hypothetical protein
VFYKYQSGLNRDSVEYVSTPLYCLEMMRLLLGKSPTTMEDTDDRDSVLLVNIPIPICPVGVPVSITLECVFLVWVARGTNL